MSDWSQIPKEFIAIATDRHGMIHGFSTPPRFHGPSGSWQPTDGGKKTPAWLSNSPPGDAAGNTVEYRPGFHPHENGKQLPPAFGIAISGAESALGLANLEAIAKATGRTIDEVRDPQNRSAIEPTKAVTAQAAKIIEQYPTGERTTPAGPKIVEDDGSTRAVVDPGVGASSGEAAPERLSHFEIKPPTMTTTMMTLPSSPLHVGDPVPPRGPNDLGRMLCPPSFVPNTYGPLPSSGLTDLATAFTKALLEKEATRRHEKLVEALDLILSVFETMGVRLTPGKNQNSLIAARALVESLKPAPTLTAAEKDVVNQLAMLDTQAQQMRDAGKTEEFIKVIQDPMRSFLAGIKEERDAKIAKGAQA